jgi:hypothetical protein
MNAGSVSIFARDISWAIAGATPPQDNNNSMPMAALF